MEQTDSIQALVEAVRQGDLLQIFVWFAAGVIIGLGYFVWMQYKNARDDHQRGLDMMLSVRDAINELNHTINDAANNRSNRQD